VRWATLLMRLLARGDAEDVLGDLEEAHRHRLQRHGRLTAFTLTALETVDMAAAIISSRVTRLATDWRNGFVQDYKLGLRMLVKYPGLTLAGGLALAIAIGIGAGWYDGMSDFWRPRIPLPGGDRIVEVEMRNPHVAGDERRLLHDFVTWRQTVRSIEDLGAYRTLERNLVVGDGRPEPVVIAEISPSAFRMAQVPPVLGRPLLDADEQPGAPAVVLLGHTVWQRQFGGRPDAIGRTVQLGRVPTTVVGVMPEGFAFPINHRLWVPLQLRPSGYAPLEGPEIRVFGRLSREATQAQAYAEVTALTERIAAASPGTHQHLRPRVLAYGGESPGDRSVLELLLTHLPIALVLVVACANVGTLIYARTATRDAEIVVRYALGASRGRIVGQLFVEALVLAALAAVVGLAVAHVALKWGITAYYSGTSTTPFWVDPGLKLTTVIYAALLTVGGAALLSVFPALKLTGPRGPAQLKNLGAGGSTLKFGWMWTTVMIAQVALTVICIPPSMGFAHEAWRDRMIRQRFPGEEYLAVRLALDREIGNSASGPESASAFAVRLEQTYAEFERRVAQEPDVLAVTFGDRLPGMGVSVRRAEVEVSSTNAPVFVPNLWTTAVGPRFFESFGIPIVAGRDFHDGDRTTDARTVLVNEAFARRYMDGASPVGRRVRYASTDPAVQAPWFEIVGMVGDIGMTPTDLGEAPYVYRAVSPATTHPLVMGVRLSGDPAALAQRLRVIAAELDPRLRLDETRSLEDFAWREDLPQTVVAGAVGVARRTREIGLRTALGATPARLLADIFVRAFVLVGSGVAIGNLVIVLLVAFGTELDLTTVVNPLLRTSAIMLTVGLLACIEPARRALRIHPTDALKDA
jgi:putative ABC transport system permease protein